MEIEGRFKRFWDNVYIKGEKKYIDSSFSLTQNALTSSYCEARVEMLLDSIVIPLSGPLFKSRMASSLLHSLYLCFVCTSLIHIKFQSNTHESYMHTPIINTFYVRGLRA